MLQFGEENDELVASHPGQAVVRPQAPEQPLRIRAQQLVADFVAVRIVYGFEIVKIDEHDAQRQPAAVSLGDSHSQAIVQQETVGQIRERIVGRHELEAFLGLLEIGNVANEHD